MYLCASLIIQLLLDGKPPVPEGSSPAGLGPLVPVELEPGLERVLVRGSESPISIATLFFLEPLPDLS